MRAHLTSNRIRRHQLEPEQSRLADGAQPKLTAAEPPVPEKPPRPFGDLATASAAQIADLAAEHFSVERNGRALNRHGMLWLLERLEEFPGRTWQQRWEAAGLNGPGHPVESLAGDDRQRRTRFNAAAQHAYCMRLIRPSLAAFNATRLFRYADRFRRVAGDRLRNPEVRELLVDYLRRRSVEVDYSTLDNLVRNLVQYFWKVVEDVNPGQADLRLDEQTVQEWKQRLLVRSDGKPRVNIEGPFLTVRGFYLDLQTWAPAEPERWGRWVAPCPIRDTDLRWFNQRRRRIAERMANRTRERQTLLPLLSEQVTSEWQRLRALLDAARRVSLGDTFTLEGVTWQRTATQYDRQQAGRPGEAIRVLNRRTGELVRLSQAERLAFWQWAIVETLRLA